MQNMRRNLPDFKKPEIALAALAASLALLLLAGWLLPQPVISSNRAGPIIPASAPDDSADAAIRQWSGVILARPLFDPSRRPSAQASAAQSFSLPPLVAIIVVGGTRSAIFTPPGEKSVAITQGGSIGPYQVIGITPVSVELLGPSGRIGLALKLVKSAPGT